MIKVIIERDCQPGKEKQVGDLLIQLRTIAMQHRWSGLFGQETGVYKWETALDS
jgi:hypothetical protein